MKVLITGGSSGIGLSFAKEFKKRGYEIILVARDEKKLKESSKEIGGNVKTYKTDLTKVENCKKLYEDFKDENIDILINSAGFGLHGKFLDDDLDKQIEMIDLNIKATQILTKLFLADMKKRDSGYILNIASTAAFSPGPLMATYYSTKAYVLRLTEAIYEEIIQEKSNVYIGCLCPGPVATHFNDQLGIKFSKAQNSDDLAKYAIDKMFKKKLVIIPTFSHKANAFFNKFVPTKILLKANYNVQIKKINNAKKK